MAPIFLPSNKTTQTSDEAGILITKTVLPHYIPGPYTPDLLPNHLKVPEDLRYIPPLSILCLKALIPHVDSIDLGGCPRLRYHPEAHTPVLKGLIDFFHAGTREQDMVYVGPRIWGTLIQIYAALPECFGTYTLPLSDTHLTVLQGIKSTADFTLITVLDLSSCKEMSDDAMVALKPLANLCALDLSGTLVSTWGVQQLSMCLVPGTKSGPRSLRMWSLRGCRRVDDSVKSHLVKFAMLSVIDLRGTSVKSTSTIPGFKSSPSDEYRKLYHPFPPLEWINAICETFPQSRVFQADPQTSRPHILHINRLHHSAQAPVRRLSSLLEGTPCAQTVNDGDRIAALLPSGKQTLLSGSRLENHELLLAMERRKTEEERRKLEKVYGRQNRRRDWSPYAEYGDYDDVGEYDEMRDSDLDDLDINRTDFDDRTVDSYNSEDDEISVDDYDIEVHNTIATLENEREMGARQAQIFYGRDRWPLDHTQPIVQNRTTLQPTHYNHHELTLMFFRIPPGFETNGEEEEVKPRSKRIKMGTEVISANKRIDSSSLINSVWAHKRSSQANQQEIGHGSIKVDKSMGNLRPSSAQHTSGEQKQIENSPVAQFSMNPFLAKKKPSSRTNSSNKIATDPHSSMQSIAKPLPPAALPTATSNNARSTVNSKSRISTGAKHRAKSPDVALDISKTAKQSRSFDMKAWATQPKK